MRQQGEYLPCQGIARPSQPPVHQESHGKRAARSAVEPRGCTGFKVGQPPVPQALGSSLCSPYQAQQEGADWASSVPGEFTSRGETQINRQLQGRVENTGPTCPSRPWPRPCSPCSESRLEAAVLRTSPPPRGWFQSESSLAPDAHSRPILLHPPFGGCPA